MSSVGDRGIATVDDDGDLAFELQLGEALKASLLVQSKETLEIDMEMANYEIAKSEAEKAKEDLNRRIHDQRVALEISRIPEDEWSDTGDWFGRPYGEGCSKSTAVQSDDEVFRVYFKGSRVGHGSSVIGMGVAICDSRDGLLFELKKPLVSEEDRSKQGAEMTALILSLTTALELGLKRVAFYCDHCPTYFYVTQQWLPRQKKILDLLDQVVALQQKFVYCQPFLIARKDVKFALQLSRDALDIHKNARSALGFETCAICLEDTNVHQIFSVDACAHRYCFSCMKQHVEVKLLHGILPNCPHEKCTTQLKIESCSDFLTPKLTEIMTQRIKEASIPPSEKVYCPYPKCSTLMSKSKVLAFSISMITSERFAARKCMKCEALFCISCKAPWHDNLTCSEYKARNPQAQAEDAKLKSLAARNMWRQCVKCSHMIELAAGCYHMTCRCGFEFCYTCGAEWRKGKATCSCPLWNEDNIIDTESEDDEDDYYL